MIPSRLEAVCLDAGNVLVGIDLPWVRRLLAERGVVVDLEALRRAEAASRPVVAAAIAREASTESAETFLLYVRTTLARLGNEDAGLARDLAAELKAAGNARLWSWVLPGVPEALDGLRALDLRLAVVSNSDGTIAETLERAGLGGRFDVVVDSAVVGFEKPDPRIFDAALEALGAARERTLHVGDLYSADVVGARRAGLRAVLVDPYEDWPEVDCVRVRDLGDLGGRLAASGGRL